MGLAAYHFVIAGNIAAKLKVVETYIGGTSVFPEFYMNIENNSTKEVTYIGALFKVYDWEMDSLKAETRPTLLDYERDGFTIKPGEIKTLKTSLFDLKYKENDIIKYKLIDVKTK
jgi:hypothetical protein